MKFIWLFFLPIIVFASHEFDKMRSSDFVSTKEDIQKIAKFEAIYEKAKASKKADSSIEKIFHIVWIGSRNLTSLQQQNILSWMKKHPDWQVQFWTDRTRNVFHKKIKFKIVDPVSYYTDNDLEKETLLSYEILKNEGGVYLHPDLECFQSLDDLNDRYSFYAELLPPKERGYSSSILIGHHLIAASKNHPIILKTLENIKENWNCVQKAFTFPDQQTAEYRLLYRGFAPLDEAVLSSATSNTMIFSSDYFYHQNPVQQPLFKSGVRFEEKIDSYIKGLNRKVFNINYIAFPFLVIFISFLFLYIALPKKII